MNLDIGAMTFGAEETRLGAMANGAEVLARRRTWRCPGVDVDKASAPQILALSCYPIDLGV